MTFAFVLMFTSVGGAVWIYVANMQEVRPCVPAPITTAGFWGSRRLRLVTRLCPPLNARVSITCPAQAEMARLDKPPRGRQRSFVGALINSFPPHPVLSSPPQAGVWKGAGPACLIQNLCLFTASLVFRASRCTAGEHSI